MKEKSGLPDAIANISFSLATKTADTTAHPDVFIVQDRKITMLELINSLE